MHFFVRMKIDCEMPLLEKEIHYETRNYSSPAGIVVTTFLWLEAGDVAPDFSLQGSDRQIHRLADYRGREAVVLAWFPQGL